MQMKLKPSFGGLLCHPARKRIRATLELLGPTWAKAFHYKKQE